MYIVVIKETSVILLSSCGATVFAYVGYEENMR